MKKKGRPAAQWPLQIEDGNYTLEQLTKQFNRNLMSVRWIMNKYALDKRYTVVNGRVVIVYFWSKEHYLKKCCSSS